MKISRLVARLSLLTQQAPFINQNLAYQALGMPTQLLRHGSVSYKSGFCNLAMGQLAPLPIRAFTDYSYPTRIGTEVPMFLETLKLNNFRSFEEERICFATDLTILVGENNGGKSNAIDALRLVTTPLSGRREIYCESTDIRLGSAEPRFELDATFADLSVPQQGRLISAVTDHTLQKVIFGLSFDESDKRLPVRPTT